MISDTLAHAWLNSLRGTPYSLPRLYAGAILDDDNEVSVSGYRRVRIDTLMGDPSGGEMRNDFPIVFPVAEASWGTVDRIAIYSQESGGAALHEAAPVTLVSIGNGDFLTVAAGNLVIKFRDGTVTFAVDDAGDDPRIEQSELLGAGATIMTPGSPDHGEFTGLPVGGYEQPAEFDTIISPE